MNEKNIQVPYKSQHDPDSTASNSDCGAASLAMVLEYYGLATSTGQIIDTLVDYDYLNFNQLSSYASSKGFESRKISNASFLELKNYLDQNIPVIVVGGYGYLESTMDKKFKGSHIMVIRGYRPDGGVYANDPNFWGVYREDGDNHNYTKDEFLKFWENKGNDEGNQPNTMFVVLPKDTISVKKELVVSITSDKLNIRTSPQINKTNIALQMEADRQLMVDGFVEGDEVQGNNLWWKVVTTTTPLYAWSGGTDKIPTKGVGIQSPVEFTKEELELIEQLKVTHSKYEGWDLRHMLEDYKATGGKGKETPPPERTYTQSELEAAVADARDEEAREWNTKFNEVNNAYQKFLKLGFQSAEQLESYLKTITDLNKPVPKQPEKEPDNVSPVSVIGWGWLIGILTNGKKKGGES